MVRASDILENVVPISDFSHGKASSIFKSVSHNPVFVIKNNKPEAVILSLSEYSRLSEIEEDFALLSLALERLSRSDPSEYISHEVLMEKLDISNEDLLVVEEPELA